MNESCLKTFNLLSEIDDFGTLTATSRYRKTTSGCRTNERPGNFIFCGDHGDERGKKKSAGTAKVAETKKKTAASKHHITRRSPHTGVCSAFCTSTSKQVVDEEMDIGHAGS